MTNKRNWLGILVMVLVFGMTVVGCEEETKDDPITYIKWRSELTDNSGIGLWLVGNYSDSNYKQLYFDSRWTDYRNPSEAQVRAGKFDADHGYDYKLISKDDKPAGEESSFTIKASSGSQYTIKYILNSGGGSISITDIGGIDADNFQNHIAVDTYFKSEF
jgi:hypothetical protein